MSTNLAVIAREMVQGPGGILAADESKSTMNRRLIALGLKFDPEEPTLRHAWREVVFGASLPGVNAVIVYEEQLMNPDLMRMLEDQHVLIVVKTDLGLEKFRESSLEEVS